MRALCQRLELIKDCIGLCAVCSLFPSQMQQKESSTRTNSSETLLTVPMWLTKTWSNRVRRFLQAGAAFALLQELDHRGCCHSGSLPREPCIRCQNLAFFLGCFRGRRGWPTSALHSAQGLRQLEAHATAAMLPAARANIMGATLS